jgi:hypothetical protein
MRIPESCKLTVLLLSAIVLAASVAHAELLVNDLTTHEQSVPRIAASGPMVYVVYQDTTHHDYDVRLAVSDDSGASFAPTNLVHPDSRDEQWQPALAIGPGGEVYLVWAENSGGTWDIMLTSTSDGETFSAPVMVNDISANSQLEPAIAVSPSGTIWVAWHDSRDSAGLDYGVRWDVYAARSEDGGSSFDPGIRLSDEQSSGEQYFALFPEIAAPDDDHLLAVWYKMNWGWGDRRLRSSVSSDSGENFSTPDTLFTGWAMRHRLDASDDGRAMLVWEETFDQGPQWDLDLVVSSGTCLDVAAKASNDYGASWSGPIRLNQERMLNQQRPGVALTTGGFGVVWSDDREVGDYTIRLAEDVWPPLGPIAGTKIDDYSDLAERTFPDVAADGANLYIVWQDFRSGDYDIYMEGGQP